MSAIDEDLPNDGTKLAEGLKNCGVSLVALAEPPDVPLPPIEMEGTVIDEEEVDPPTSGTDTLGTLIVGADILLTLGKNGTEL